MPSPLPTAVPTQNQQDMLQYKMNRNLVTVVDVWREYSVGVNGGPSIKHLEETYNTKWRTQGQNRTESRFFNRRLNIYKEVQKLSTERGITCEEAAQFLECTRIAGKMTLNQLCERIASSMLLY